MALQSRSASQTRKQLQRVRERERERARVVRAVVYIFGEVGPRARGLKTACYCVSYFASDAGDLAHDRLESDRLLGLPLLEQGDLLAEFARVRHLTLSQLGSHNPTIAGAQDDFATVPIHCWIDGLVITDTQDYAAQRATRIAQDCFSRAHWSPPTTPPAEKLPPPAQELLSLLFIINNLLITPSLC